MKIISNYFWVLLLTLLVIHGADVFQNEWQRRSIHHNGEIVEIKIEKLNCPKGTLTFNFQKTPHEKKIDARTCALLNEGQKIKLKHSRQYPDKFLFVNEQSPNHFILGGLEMVLGIVGLIANWPAIKLRRTRGKNFQTLKTILF